MGSARDIQDVLYCDFGDMRWYLRMFGLPPSVLTDLEAFALYRLITGKNAIALTCSGRFSFASETEMLVHALSGLAKMEEKAEGDEDFRKEAVKAITWKVGGLALKVSDETGATLEDLGGERFLPVQRAMRRGGSMSIHTR